MLQAFQDHIDSEFPELREFPFLIAVSGGVDSVVLAHLCRSAQLNFGIAHVNFSLRGSESDADAAFVADLAAAWGVPYYSTTFDTLSVRASRKGGTQEVARDLRYSWFAKLIASEPFDYLVTAHHADDDLETFVLHLSRGAGLKGLSGIPKRRDFICRPLLGFSKEEILAYAEAQGVSWREDTSNESDTYLRNSIRQQVVPKLKEVAPEIIAAFRKTRAHLQDASNLLDKHIQTIKNQVYKIKKDRIEIAFSDLAPFGNWTELAYPLLAEYGFTDWRAIRELEKADSGTIIRSASHEILKDREVLVLRPLEVVQSKEKEGIRLVVDRVSEMEAGTPNTLYIDKESLKHRLNARKWQKGDYFYPLGMGGKKKKLSKFFKDIKLDVFAKEEQWVLCDGEDIVWVVGQRADERYKVHPDTDSILRITWTD